jgi:ABC-2 type transport system ATP-binding protein
MLEARDLGKFYSGIPAVKGVNFTVRRGDVLGLLGPNGSGKSTTVSMITCLLEPTTGQVLLDGEPVDRAPLEYKARIGYVPEEAHLYTYLTGPEYLELIGQLRGIAPRVLQDKIGAFLRIFGLEDDRYAQMSAYSKGMRQKILISAALLHNPTMLVLDEPLTGLDTDSAVVVKHLLSTLASQGRTVLYSSHVLEVVERVCARVLILNRGTIIADGSPAELKSATHESTLEDVFRQVTQADDVEPRVARIMSGLTL